MPFQAAGAWCDQAGDQAKDGALAAAGRTEQAQKLPLMKGEIEALKRFGAVGEYLPYLVQANKGRAVQARLCVFEGRMIRRVDGRWLRCSTGDSGSCSQR